MSLESRYKLLLRLYPRDHRAEYGEEMLSVLLAGAGPSRRLPAALDIADIVRSAGAIHWRRAQTPSTAWRQAALVIQVFGAILLLAVDLRRLAIGLVAGLSYPHPGQPLIVFAPSEVLRPAIWAAVTLALLLRARLLTTALALAGLVTEIIVPARQYTDTPARLLDVWWLILTATAVVVASRVPPAPRPSAMGVPWVGAAGATVVASAFTELWRAESIIVLGARAVTVFSALTLAVAALLAVIGVLRSAPEVRRRVAAAAGAVAVALPMVQVGFNGFITHNQQRLQAELLNPAQWTLLLIIPAATFLFLTTAARRRERTQAEGRVI